MSELSEPSETEETPELPRQRRFSRRGLLLLLFGLLTLFVVAPAILLGPYVHYRLTRKSPTPVAVYQGFSLRQDPEFFELVTNVEEKESRPIFVQLPDERKFALLEFPEEEAAMLLPKVPPHDPPTGTNEYTDTKSFLTYRDGKLVFAVLHAKSKLFRVAGREVGPYAELPLARSELIATLGEPIRWEGTAQAPEDEGSGPGL